MDYIKAAFDAFKRHPLQWFLLGLLFGAMSNLVVGIFLLPNFIRIARTSAPADGPAFIPEPRTPEISRCLSNCLGALRLWSLFCRNLP